MIPSRWNRIFEEAASVARRHADVRKRVRCCSRDRGSDQDPRGRTTCGFCSVWQVDMGTDVSPIHDHGPEVGYVLRHVGRRDPDPRSPSAGSVLAMSGRSWSGRRAPMSPRKATRSSLRHDRQYRGRVARPASACACEHRPTGRPCERVSAASLRTAPGGRQRLLKLHRDGRRDRRVAG